MAIQGPLLAIYLLQTGRQRKGNVDCTRPLWRRGAVEHLCFHEYMQGGVDSSVCGIQHLPFVGPGMRHEGGAGTVLQGGCRSGHAGV